jgi:6-pyruvoyltetrahydropterin/6-carboxytetrahydropterin synthase
MRYARVSATKEVMFSSAHYLENYDGKCKNLHGHNYKLQVTVSDLIPCVQNEQDSAVEYMAMDFYDLKKIINDVVMDKYDHGYLNDYYINPTAEAMAVKIYDDIKKALSKDSVRLESVKLWETDGSFAEYKGEEEYN